MTKTASIASSANMEFETTAALLSQIIETTREPAETAGTAMKTIIARFTEMKKATTDLINVDGEEVSVNKVEDALASAGVALRDVNGEFRDLDDVFLELSSKWNNLDIMTQRYIATTAAGSRQQSRFIAMMQDYDRTVELVGAAYNSNGASANQFAKTQESLESKLAKLKNAWDEFLMGIANSKIIKIGVDALTGLLNIVNKLTGKSGLLKLAVAIGALKGGSVVFNKLFASMGKFGGFNLKNISQRIANFKETGSFSLKGTADTQLASKQLTAAATSAAKTQVSGATSAAKV
jgi:TP901 family phage tail tape measure protein